MNESEGYATTLEAQGGEERAKCSDGNHGGGAEIRLSADKLDANRTLIVQANQGAADAAMRLTLPMPEPARAPGSGAQKYSGSYKISSRVIHFECRKICRTLCRPPRRIC